MRENIFSNEFNHRLAIICPIRYYFYPLRHIVNCQKDVKIPIGFQKWTHEVDAQIVKTPR